MEQQLPFVHITRRRQLRSYNPLYHTVFVAGSPNVARNPVQQSCTFNIFNEYSESAVDWYQIFVI